MQLFAVVIIITIIAVPSRVVLALCCVTIGNKKERAPTCQAREKEGDEAHALDAPPPSRSV